MVRYVGIDLHKRLLVAHFLDAQGNTLTTARCEPVTAQTLERFAKRHLQPGDQLALEVTTHCWAVVRFLLPSVVQESFGRVAAEAMMNGIPVVASNRGALPEVVGVSDLLKELPGWLTADSRKMPSEKEIQGWVETIERLWDEPTYYQAVASELRERSGAWDPEAMAARLECVLFAPGSVPGES